MEIDTNDTEAATNSVTAKPETASKKSGFIQSIRRSLAEPAPSIKALDALAEVQSPTPPPQPNESVREAGVAGDIYKLDDQDCGCPTR
jgi:hypothetical protein